VSDWCLTPNKQLYYSENKVQFNEMMMMMLTFY